VVVRAFLRFLLVGALVVAGMGLSPSLTTASSDLAVTVLDVQVRTGADDAEERTTGKVSLSSGDLNLGKEDAATQTVGIRFTGVTVPRGATITSAYVQFTADEVKTATGSLSIAGQASDNPATFTTSRTNISTRPRTTASVAWTPASWPIVNARTAAERTPDLSTVVQEIVHRSDWASGDPLVLIVTGAVERAADSYEGGSNKAPALHVE
jgi:hypothetical protein